MSGADAAVFARRKAEDVRDALEERGLARMEDAVGLGDLEQPVEDVFQQRGIAGEHLGDLAGIGLVAGGVLLRQAEDAVDAGLLAWRDAEQTMEGLDLVVGHRAVGLRHLGGERDHRDGEDDARRIARRDLLHLAVDQEMAGQRADQRADRAAAQHESGRRAAELSEDGHGQEQ